MAILLTPAIINRATAKFMREKIIKENIGDTVPPGRESHIWNLYEDLRMPLSGIIDIAKLALEGKLENVQEKVDGQNITFTVRDGVLRFFTKMSLVSDRDLNNASAKIQSGKGMDLSLISEKYEDKPGIVAAFSMGYEALEPVALQFQDSLFKNGDVVIVSGLITAVNPSTIIYDADTFRFIAPVSLTQEPVNEEAYRQFLQQARAATTEAFSMDSVPVAKLISDLETDDAEIETLVGDLESVVSDAGLSVGSATVGDYVAARVEKLLREKYSFIPEEMIEDVTNRFMTGKGAVANRLKKLVSSDDYQRFRSLDGLKSEVVAEAIVPLEAVIQRLGVMIIDKLDLTLTASNQDDLRAFVRRARDAFSKGKILADEKTLEKIRVALARLEENEELFTKATEGIVFTYNGDTYKLTGLFTPINRLRGFFDYDKKATIRDENDMTNTLQEIVNRAAERFILEGGIAFKDSLGNVVTRHERIPRAEVEPIVTNFVRDILDPMGIEYIPVGTTSTDYPTAGDIDIGVNAIDAKSLLAMLSSNPDLQVELSDAPGVKRLYKLPGGAGVAVLYKVPMTGDLVQVDLMPTKGVDLDDFSWMLAGASSGGVKSRYRNILLSWIANRVSERETQETGEPVKYTYARGLLKKVNNVPIGPRETDPDVFLPALGITPPRGDIRSFEGLVAAMREDQFLSSILPGFKDYIDNRGHLQSNDPQRRAEAEGAINHIENLQENLLESLIKRILEVEFPSSDRSARMPGKTATTLYKDSGIEGLVGPVKDPLDKDTFEGVISISWLKANHVDPDNLLDGNKYRAEFIPDLLMGQFYSTANDSGTQFEFGLMDYMRALEVSVGGKERAEKIPGGGGRGRGEDIEFKSKRYESKKTMAPTPNTQFNSTFPKDEGDLFYLFSVSVPTDDEIQEVLGKFMAEPSGGEREIAVTAWGDADDDERDALRIQFRDAAQEEEDNWIEYNNIERKIDELERNSVWPQTIQYSPPGSEDEVTKSIENEADLEKFKKQVDSDWEDFKHGKKLSKAEKDEWKKLNKGKKFPTRSRIVTLRDRDLKALGRKMEAFIIPSGIVRNTLLHNSFPEIFDENGVPAGEKLVANISEKLETFGLARKIGNKILPDIVKVLETGNIDPGKLETNKKIDEGWDLDWGALNIRLKVYIEPKSSTKE